MKLAVGVILPPTAACVRNASDKEVDSHMRSEKRKQFEELSQFHNVTPELHHM